MPPEQVRNQPLTKACDLYGLGLTLVCTIAGLAPQDIGQYLDASNQLDRKAIASNLKVCSSSFTQWLHQMIAPDLKQRFPDAKTAWDALQPLSIRPDPTNQGRRKFMLSLAIGGGSLIAASLGWLLKPTTTGNITNPEEEFSPPDLTEPLLPYLNLNTRWNSYDLDNFLSHLDESRQQILISCLEKVSEFNVETINAEVVRLSSSFIGYRFQDKQHFDYHDFVEDVAKSYDINLEIIESKNTFQLERMILEEAFADFWDQLDSSGREELLTAIDETQELGKNLSSTGLVMLSGSAVLASLSATINLSGFAFYTTMSIAIHGIASALGIALPFAVYTGSSSLFAFLAGLPGLILMAMGAVGGALTLGLSKGATFWRVHLPLAWPGILAGLMLAFARAMGEFGATLMLAGSIEGKTQTLSIAIYEAVQAGDQQAANHLALLTSLVCVVLLYLAKRVSQPRWQVPHV